MVDVVLFNQIEAVGAEKYRSIEADHGITEYIDVDGCCFGWCCRGVVVEVWLSRCWYRRQQGG